MLDQLAASEGFPVNATALEVGCAHGWFLDALKSRGFHAIGIEPDSHVASIARASGHEVLSGFFPAALAPEARFDVVFFNDVFEHLPDVKEIVGELCQHTVADGWVVVNTPVSDGAVFRTARFLARLGAHGPYQRMWQEGLPSPHLSYFSSENLVRLFTGRGFRLHTSGSLRSVTAAGLMARIRFDRRINRLLARAYYAVALAAVPLLPLLPPDIRFFAFRKQVAALRE
jgi:2-polyprenyl-3-methyl-5-hydroxy-6-metoxy-1,4-benzoquinol methylase